MTEQGDIINRLLDKYENSRHLSDPGTSPRRVMLKVEKRDLPAYIYEDAVIRDGSESAVLCFCRKSASKSAGNSSYSIDRRQSEGRCDSLDYSLEGRCL